MSVVKTINYIWILNKMHMLHYLALQHNRIQLEGTGWDMKIWTDDIRNVHPDFRDIAHVIDPELIIRLSQHKAARTPSGTKLRIPHLVDLIRYHILLENGGAYQDCDEFWLTSPDEVYDITRTNFLMEHKYMITNSNIFCPTTQDEHIQGILDFIDSDHPDFDYSCWAATGPYAVTPYLMNKFKDNLPSDIARNQYNYPHTYTIEEQNCYPGVHLIPESVFPIKWTRYHRMINDGIPFDMNKYRDDGYKIVGLFGSQIHKGAYKDGEIYVDFITNTGHHRFIHGEKGTMVY